MMADDGWKSISPEEFASRVHGKTVPQAEAPQATPLASSLIESQLTGSLEENIARQLAFLGNPAIVEFQSLGWKRRANDTFEHVRAAHALSLDEAIRLCIEADKANTHGVYILPAPLHPGVETRHAPPGTWFEIPKGGGTTDSDIAARLVLAVDFDVKRPTGTSASDDELLRSVELSTKAYDYLSVSAPNSLAYLHSGNGRQIHIALDSLPNDEQTRDLCAGLLVGFDALWSTPLVSIDKKLFDAKRILPACGTVKKKGATGIATRPHRRTAIVTPEKVSRLSLEQLKDLARKLWYDLGNSGRAAMDKTITGSRPQTNSPLPAPSVAQLTPKPDSPFSRAKAIPARDVAEWLGLLDADGQPTCPGCGSADSGVAILEDTSSGARGFKCSHNRCSTKGRPPGFRTNIDLVMEVRGVDSLQATKLMAERFGFEGFSPSSSPSSSTPQKPAVQLRRLNEIIPASLERVQRRADGKEKPIPLPWPSLAAHYGGGWWPGVHFICSGTGVGKTAAALQMAMHGAKNDFPVVYVGLELEEMQIALRLVSEHGHIPWSPLYTGTAPAADINLARGAALDLMALNLPFYPIFSRPQGWPPSELLGVAEAMRLEHPEDKDEAGNVIPGSRPLMLVLDFLQIIGEEPDDARELRERIGRAAYLTRYIAAHFNMVVIVISSIARDKYLVLSNAIQQAGITFDETTDGKPINRKMRNPDALVGLGKESGDIEFSGDSVSAIARLPNSDDILWATAKGRATGASWTPMRFTGFRYEESPDGGASLVAGLRAASQKRSDAKKEKLEESVKNAVEIVRYVIANPRCGVGVARQAVVAGNASRWSAALGVLGGGIVVPPNGSKVGLQLAPQKLPKSVVDELGTVTLETLEATLEGSKVGFDDSAGNGSTLEDLDLGRGLRGPLQGTSSKVGPGGGTKVSGGAHLGTGVSPRWTDAQSMHMWASQGLDPRGKATEEGWSDERIAAALPSDGDAPGDTEERREAEAPEPQLAPEVDLQAIQAERDAEVLVGLFPKEQKAHMKDWTKERRWRARAALKKLGPTDGEK